MPAGCGAVRTVRRLMAIECQVFFFASAAVKFPSALHSVPFDFTVDRPARIILRRISGSFPPAVAHRPLLSALTAAMGVTRD